MITVLILAAGYGRRMGPFSRMINKGLVPYNNKPLISHIMEKFDHDTKFVIACGHMGQQIKDYVTVVHDDRNVIYVDIDDYVEGSTGPATTIQKCAEHLSGGFVWLSCDTLFDFDYKSNMDHNWIGVYPVNSEIAQDYCWIERNGENITQINNKQTSKVAVDAFIGLMHCKDIAYVNNLKSVNATEACQGMLPNLELRAHTVRSWLDFGTYDKWVKLSADLKEVSFPKPNEIFYQDNGKIIKFTYDVELVERKGVRALLNQSCMPSEIKVSGQFLVYNYVQGDIIYNQLTPKLFISLLDWANKDLWKLKWFPDSALTSREFYYKKTIGRLEQFRAKYALWNEPRTVNGVAVKSIDYYLRDIDWNWLCDTTKWGFIHGDFQMENIIFNPIGGRFTAIDWRSDFAGSNYGDIYYDLAKLAGGLFLNYQDVKANKLEYHEDNESVVINDCGVNDVDIYVNQLKVYCIANDLEWKKVQQLIPIIYLNMSPLHEAPFDKYLFALSQLYFERLRDVSQRCNTATK